MVHAGEFGAANIIIGISLFFFLPYSGTGANSTPMFAIIGILFLFTMGELCCPRLVTRLLPRSRHVPSPPA